jgi:hypothetical protein
MPMPNSLPQPSEARLYSAVSFLCQELNKEAIRKWYGIAGPEIDLASDHGCWTAILKEALKFQKHCG